MFDEYQQLIDDALDEQSDLFILNREQDDVRYVLAKFLENAEHVVRIFTPTVALSKKENGDVGSFYDDKDLLDAARTFLQKQDALLLVVSNEDRARDSDIATPLIQLAEEMKESDNELKGILWVGTISDEAPNGDWQLGHWQVMDRKAYRLEHDMKNRKAHVNFGRPDVASNLAKQFSRVIRHATLKKVVN